MTTITNSNCSYIMLHLAKMFSTSNVSCIVKNGEEVMKYALNDDLSFKLISPASSEEAKRRTQNTKNTSWEASDDKSSILFEDHDLKLCLRLPSPIDNQHDIYYVTIRPTLGSFIFVHSGSDKLITTNDKEIIAAMCYSSCESMLNILMAKSAEEQELGEVIKHHEKTIAQLKKSIDIPQQKTRNLIESKLNELSKLYEKTFTLSRDAESFVDMYAGDDITVLIEAIERSAAIKSKIYANSQITIDDSDIIIRPKKESQSAAEATTDEQLDTRHAKLIQWLEKLEDAFNTTIENGLKPTATNIAKEMNMKSASITMWFNNHSEDAKRLCEANVNLCKNSRRQFDPLKDAIAGKRNKANRA